ncbi:TlpA disulfide reductase family protein [Arachidicoccus terrestris]|uniref:TlpA disulfide reductase family protein n=1 Tax=Arachidicoccus terrestris TaxID=2875539 RepID=UPI001CC7A5DD|nr:TlpA disulfide reductase family protein [Arachidicoccus terrestris]UAY55392.1 AhpC/TSA family protein [Arachidicoccus terrestris]
MLIKKILLLWLMMPVLALAEPGFRIKGSITGVLNGTVAITQVYGVTPEQAASIIGLPKASIKDGAFEFTGQLAFPVLVDLKISTRKIRVFLENTCYTITGNFQKLSGASLKGGVANHAWQSYLTGGRPMDNYIRENANTIVAAYLTWIRSTDTRTKAIEDFKILGTYAKNSWYGQQLKRRIGAYRATGVGTVFPELITYNLDGSPFSLSDLPAKLAVIDFWASWCAPCRKFIPKLQSIYEKYNGKGVSFVSVSVDDDLNRWKSAVNNERMPWTQVIAKDGFEDGKGIKHMLHIFNIPYLIIVDKEGKIVASLDAYQKVGLDAILKSKLE